MAAGLDHFSLFKWSVVQLTCSIFVLQDEYVHLEAKVCCSHWWEVLDEALSHALKGHICQIKAVIQSFRWNVPDFWRMFFNSVGRTILSIVNSSLSTKNFRPISKLRFLNLKSFFLLIQSPSWFYKIILAPCLQTSNLHPEKWVKYLSLFSIEERLKIHTASLSTWFLLG